MLAVHLIVCRVQHNGCSTSHSQSTSISIRLTADTPITALGHGAVVLHHITCPFRWSRRCAPSICTSCGVFQHQTQCVYHVASIRQSLQCGASEMQLRGISSIQQVQTLHKCSWFSHTAFCISPGFLRRSLWVQCFQRQCQWAVTATCCRSYVLGAVSPHSKGNNFQLRLVASALVQHESTTVLTSSNRAEHLCSFVGTASAFLRPAQLIETWF